MTPERLRRVEEMYHSARERGPGGAVPLRYHFRVDRWSRGEIRGQEE